MRFIIQNVGPIRDANFEFGKLTVLCGKNNTGKTYITYNTFNFLDAIKRHINVPVAKEVAEQLLREGRLEIHLLEYLSHANEYIAESMRKWIAEDSSRYMATKADYYRSSVMRVEVEQERWNRLGRDLRLTWAPRVTQHCSLQVSKSVGTDVIEVVLVNQGEQLPDVNVILSNIKFLIKWCFGFLIPDLFVITCERTGAAVFRASFMAQQSAEEDAELVNGAIKQWWFEGDKRFRGYPLPVAKDMKFSLELDEISTRTGDFAKQHPQILSYFEKIAGGCYSVQDHNAVKFVPSGKDVGLSPVESSSSVRSLMELGFYLKHKAKDGQCLVIDEPELNLHPDMQRKVARLLARLVNAGIYVAITTHSDYVIKELNTLIMLGYEDVRSSQLMAKYGYERGEILKAADVRAYCTTGAGVEPMPVSQDVGITVRSFDDSIREMAQIQNDIAFGRASFSANT